MYSSWVDLLQEFQDQGLVSTVAESGLQVLAFNSLTPDPRAHTMCSTLLREEP